MQKFCKTVNLKDSLKRLEEMRNEKAQDLEEMIDLGVDKDYCSDLEEDIHAICCVYTYMCQFLDALKNDGSDMLIRNSFMID